MEIQERIKVRIIDKNILLLGIGILLFIIVITLPLLSQNGSLAGDFPAKGRYVHDLGTRWYAPNDEACITDEFVITNPLDKEMLLNVASKSCSCIITDISNIRLQPKDSIVFKISIPLSTDNAFLHEEVILKTNNSSLPLISLSVRAHVIPYYSIELPVDYKSSMRDGESLTLPVVVKVYAPNNTGKMKLVCNDEYVTIEEENKTVRKCSKDLYELIYSCKITVQCEISKIKSSIVHNTLYVTVHGK